MKEVLFQSISYIHLRETKLLISPPQGVQKHGKVSSQGKGKFLNILHWHLKYLDTEASEKLQERLNDDLKSDPFFTFWRRLSLITAVISQYCIIHMVLLCHSSILRA